MVNEKIDDLIEAALTKLPKRDISGALLILEGAGETENNQAELDNLKADCYYLLGDFYQAKGYWEKVLESNNSNKTAKNKLEKFNSPAFQFWLKRYYQALNLIENKEFLPAQENLQKLMKENDNFVSLYQLLGLTYLALNDEKNALKVWKQGLKLDISNPELIRYLNTPKKGLRRARFTPSKPSEPNSSPKSNILLIVSGMFIMLLLLQMSFSMNNERDYKDTVKSLQAKISSLNEELKKEPEAVAVTSGINNLAEDIVHEVLPNEGSYYDVEYEGEYYKKGYQAYLDQDYKTAISNLSVVVGIASDSYINREGLYYLALSYYNSKNFDEAENYFLQYLEQFPNTNYTDESLYFLAGVYYFKNDLDKAEIMLEELNNYDPESGYKSTNLYQEITQAII